MVERLWFIGVEFEEVEVVLLDLGVKGLAEGVGLPVVAHEDEEVDAVPGAVTHFGVSLVTHPPRLEPVPRIAAERTILSSLVPQFPLLHYFADYCSYEKGLADQN